MSESMMPGLVSQKCTQLYAESYGECRKNTNQDILSSNTITLHLRSCTSQHEQDTDSNQSMFKVVFRTVVALSFYASYLSLLSFATH